MLVPSYNIPTKIDRDNFESFLQLWNEIVCYQGGILIDPLDEMHYRPLSVCLINSLFEERDFRIKSRPNYWEDLISNLRQMHPEFAEQISKIDQAEFKETSDKFNKMTRKIGAGIWSTAGLNLSLRFFPSNINLVGREKLWKQLLNYVKEKGVIHKEVTAFLYDTLKETIENSFSHGDSERGCFVSIQIVNNSIEICTLDRGIGILKSLIEKYPDLKNSETAISQAVKKNVTRTRFPDKGKGLWSIKHGLSKCGGSMNIYSDNGIYSFDSVTNTEISSTFKESFPGTIVEVKIKNNPSYKYWDDELDSEIF